MSEAVKPASDGEAIGVGGKGTSAGGVDGEEFEPLEPLGGFVEVTTGGVGTFGFEREFTVDEPAGFC